MTGGYSVRPKNKRLELKYQGHILDSYKTCGGTGRKWASDLQVGAPDLVVALPTVGLHLMEVKHRPEWRLGHEYQNPLDKAQVRVARDYVLGGALVVGAVVVESSEAVGSYLVLFDPLASHLTPGGSATMPYVKGAKYDVETAMLEFTRVL